jgi:DNA-binding transcriptional MerR regulator
MVCRGTAQGVIEEAEMAGYIQIGEVAERTGLSLRTIRYYEEIGLAVPSTRSPGGFRLYDEGDVARLRSLKRMKPLGLSLDTMRELLDLLDSAGSGRLSAAGLDRLREFAETADRVCAQLRAESEAADEFARTLRNHLVRSPATAARSG